MKKKRGGSGGANWMDTYGDMVTLLLCFFVMLYSMSTLDKEKWIALVQSFNPSAVTEDATGGTGGTSESIDEMLEQMTQEQVDADIEELYQTMKAYIEQERLTTQISITKGGGYVFVSFDNTVFFDGDSYVLRDDGKVVLDQIALSIASVSDSIDEIRILGHTAQDDPNTPNDPRVDRFLATNRAAVVTVYLQEKNIIDPSRLVSVGYGQWRPIADNTTLEGRAQNRRVELLVTGLNMENGIGDDIAQYYSMRSGNGNVTGETQVTDGMTDGQAQAQTGSDQEE